MVDRDQASRANRETLYRGLELVMRLDELRDIEKLVRDHLRARGLRRAERKDALSRQKARHRVAVLSRHHLAAEAIGLVSELDVIRIGALALRDALLFERAGDYVAGAVDAERVGKLPGLVHDHADLRAIPVRPGFPIAAIALIQAPSLFT